MNHRQDAVAIVKRLRAAGHIAYFAGGCVRDELLGRTPKDYDVATTATPERVQALFEHTIPVGAQFGVIVVMTEDRQTEVATFRTDGLYIDGRRPESVKFASAAQDAERRDFTINGLFLDPLTDDIFDYVGGQNDLRIGCIRAIGSAKERFAEDRLRMLRAIRFANTLDFFIDEDTWEAIKLMADRILEVSWERIQAELSKMLVCGNSEIALEQLEASGLLQHILPEVAAMRGVMQEPDFHPEGDVFEHTKLVMRAFDSKPAEQRTLVMALASLLHDVGKPRSRTVEDGRIRFIGHEDVGAEMAEVILRRLKYPNEVVEAVVELIQQHMAFVQIREWRGAKVRRFLQRPLGPAQVELHRLDATGVGGKPKLDAHEWMMSKLDEYSKEPPPPPKLVNGYDLIDLGYSGAAIGKAIRALEDEVLEGRVKTKEEALVWLAKEHPPQGVQ